MNNRLLLLFGIIFSLTSIINAQTFVNTSPENKNIILEEFTGISCGYCPDGHLIGQTLHDNNPNDVFLINIHTGSYATPQGPGTDFNTNFGSAIAGQAGVAGYPAGTVNRHQFSMTQGGGTAMSRGDWSSASTQLLSQSSPVNVGVQANVDMGTNVLTVNVEVYYTSQQQVASNSLNVAVVQHNILGPQSGGATYNPSAIDPATGLYTHQHMLRHLLTGQWGEQITNLTPGYCYSNQFAWTMPADINGVALDPTNISVIAFVSEGNQEILSGTEVYPNISFANSYDAYCMSSSSPDAICATTTDLEVKFRNYGNINLSSLDVNYSINGGTQGTYPWTGNVAPGGTEIVTIPSVAFSPQSNNNVSISLANPNGYTDQNTGNNNASSSFTHHNSTGQVQSGFVSGNVTIDITTDQYASETSWEFLDDYGNILASAAAGSLSASSPQPTVTVPVNANECYSFIIYDSYGDGICCSYGNGSYTVADANGNIIASGGQFGSESSDHFETNGSSPAASWNCISPGNCQDPGDGSGQYNSLSSCLYSCTSTSIEEESSKLFSIYPNPSKDYIHITGVFDLIQVYDIFGKIVLISDKNVITTKELSEGLYIANIIIDDYTVLRKFSVSR